MAMYYLQGGSENQADGGLQTFYLMNPNYVGYSDHPTNMLLFNSPGATSSNAIHSIPITHDPNRPSPVSSGHQQQHIPFPAPHDALPRLGYNNSWPNMAQQTPQGLSLSLSTNQTGFSKPVNSYQDFTTSEQSNIGVNNNNNNNNNVQSVILGSKYLKAAQQLLDEVANVGKRFMAIYDKEGSKDKAKTIKEPNDYGDSTEAAASGGGGGGGGGELTTAQRQEIQMKKAKLLSILDEVEQRYRQYNIQMHIIVASFEQAAGIGSAKSYTQLALKTISKQFRCLKDAIYAQIKALSKSLGEEEKTEGSKLRYVDNQLRQHRALQQLGMVQNNTWRPQRGLPERAVSVLRAWLFEHFLHPYPKDTDKQMLAKQTGLTRGQVSNWFINARVRLWKPMVEEMYLEEMKNQQQTDNNPTKTSPDHQSNFNSTNPKNVTNHSTTTGPSIPPGPCLAQLISPPNTENSSKKPRNSPNQDDSPNSILLLETETKAATYAGTRGNMYESFGIGELNRFNPGQLRTAFHGNYNNAQNTVSLTLGLPPSRRTQNFLNFEMANEAELVDHEKGYEQILGLQNRKPFPAQLLPDFVA